MGAQFGDEQGGTTIRGRGETVAGDEAPVPLEIIAVWGLFALVAVEILLTYSRVPARELYHVSGSGVTGGTSRVLVFLNYPLALVAIPILALVAERLREVPARVAAAVGVVLAAAVFWPGVVRQSDLDARTVNAVAALGVAIAVSLTVFAVRSLGRPRRPVRQPGDRLRLAVAAVAFLLAVPWLGADLGLSFDGVPVLGTLYQTGELRTQPHVSGLHPAVHHGHHHGMDGVLLVLSALLLSRALRSVNTDWLRRTIGAYIALMLCYGLGNIANDFWLEQVVKRGWTTWEIPDVTTPSASSAWAVIVLAAVAVWSVSLLRSRRPPDPPLPARAETA